MKTPSWRDVELLSAYLDGQLSPRQQARLKARLEQDAALRQALDGLRRTRALLQRTPPRRPPRNFTLTASMAGLRPPLPRLAPTLRWVAVAALALFFFSLTFPFSLPMAGSPKSPATALVLEAATFTPQEETGVAADSTEPAAAPAFLAETPEQSLRVFALSPSPPSDMGGEASPPVFEAEAGEEVGAPERPRVSPSPFQLSLLALALLALGLSLLIGWRRQRAFRLRFMAEEQSRE